MADVARVGLESAVRDPHERALAALDDPDTSSLAAVSWTAVHLSAVERVLYPAAMSAAPSARRRVRTQMRADRRLQRAVWELDRRLTGDTHFAADQVDVLEGNVRAAIDDHAAGEQALVETLLEALDDEQQQALEERLASSMEQAPTRPHPDTPHMRLTDGLTFRLDALADQMRDLMDNRPTPTPRQRRLPRRLGRWGSYLTATPYPAEPYPAEPSAAEPAPQSAEGTVGEPSGRPPA